MARLILIILMANAEADINYPRLAAITMFAVAMIVGSVAWGMAYTNAENTDHDTMLGFTVASIVLLTLSMGTCLVSELWRRRHTV